MRRAGVTLIGLVCFINIALSQREELMVQGVSPNLYIVHKPVAKENYYSVGRLYNVAPKEIAAYNNLVFESGLRLGQAIKIPLTQNNFTQAPGQVNTKLSLPVYHIVEAKEGLYRISVNYNKVPLEQLKKWNHLSSDAVSSGTKLIIGYLKFQDPAALAKGISGNKNEVTGLPKSDQPAIKKSTDSPKEITTEIKNSNAATTTEAANSAVPVTKNETPDAKNNTGSHTAINFNGGIFKKLFDDQQAGKTAVTETGLSGVFKSTSGWRDGKYYCFNNNAPAGTIIKITNPANGKSVFAKVLDLIPDINQNAGLILHISSAAAEELEVSGSRFDCSINYSK